MKKNNKKVLFIIDSFDTGGVTTYTKNQVELLSQLGIKTIVIGCKGDIHNVSQYFDKSEVHIISKTLAESKKNIINALSTAVEYKSTLSQILSQNQSNIIIHSATIKSMLYAHLNIKTWGYKSILTFHGAQHLEIKELEEKVSIHQAIKMFFFRNIQLFFLKRADKIVVLSKYSKKVLSNHFDESLLKKTILIPGFLHLQHPIQAIRKKKGMSIINIGRAEPRKGIDVLLLALKMLKKKNILFKCYIASPVLYLKWFTKYLDIYENSRLFTSVHLLHGLNQKEKEDLLKKADVFVLPSRDYETFGYTTLEAISMGIPVIGSDSGATPEILQHIDTNLIFSSGSEQSLCDKLVWFSSLSTQEKEQISKKCISAYKKHFHALNNKNKIFSLYFEKIKVTSL